MGGELLAEIVLHVRHAERSFLVFADQRLDRVQLRLKGVALVHQGLAVGAEGACEVGRGGVEKRCDLRERNPDSLVEGNRGAPLEVGCAV